MEMQDGLRLPKSLLRHVNVTGARIPSAKLHHSPAHKGELTPESFLKHDHNGGGVGRTHGPCTSDLLHVTTSSNNLKAPVVMANVTKECPIRVPLWN